MESEKEYVNIDNYACAAHTAAEVLKLCDFNLGFSWAYSVYYPRVQYLAILHGGAIKISPDYIGNGNKLLIMFRNVSLLENLAGFSGGALFYHNWDSVNTDATVIIENSTFLRNTAQEEGGAITSIDDGISRLHLSIFNCFFGENKARIGGGVYTNGHVSITTCRFVNNLGTLGGSLYIRGEEENHIRHSTFVASLDINIFNGGSKLFLVNTTYVLIGTELGKYWMPIEAFIQENNMLKISSPFRVVCPKDFITYDKIRHPVNSTNHDILTSMTYLSVFCIPCPQGEFNYGHGQYSWNSVSGRANRTLSKCSPCPVGGKVSAVIIRPPTTPVKNTE